MHLYTCLSIPIHTHTHTHTHTLTHSHSADDARHIHSGGIFLGINAVGRRTGEAVVAMETPEQAELGLKRHKHYLDRRYVEVS